MNYEVELSIQADADLRGIYEYIAFTLLAPENAGSQLDRLESGILSLEQYPMLRAMGQLVSGYLDFAERQAEREQAMTMNAKSIDLVSNGNGAI